MSSSSFGDFSDRGRKKRKAAASEEAIPNADLDFTPCRAPNDTEPYPLEEEAEAADPGFFALFSPEGVDVSTLTDLCEIELHEGVRRLKALIDLHIGKGMSTRDLVNLVSEFYETQVRPICAQAPEWSKRSIANHIMMRDGVLAHERQAKDVVNAVYSALSLVRNHVATKNEITGKINVHGENIKLLLALSKCHASLVDGCTKRDRK